VIDRDLTTWVRNELFDQVPVSISVIDRDFRIVEANRQFSSTYGAWQDRKCYAVYKRSNAQCEKCAAKRTFEDGRIRVREEQGVLESGDQIHYLVHMVPLIRRESGEIPFVIEMSTDITYTKVLEKEKLQAERLAVVGQTVAGLAHGVKNILTGLDGGMYMARTGIQKGNMERMLTGWEMLEESVARISAFVKEFLDFAKGRAPVLTLTDPNAIARDVVNLFKDTAALENIRLEHRLSESVTLAPLDEHGIHDCLSNLVSNALDACKMSERPGGSVEVTTGGSGNTFYFEVSDDGIGIDAEISKKVFTNFFSTKGSDKGTGLGLLTTSKIVQQHGGKVSFHNREGKGSVFRLVFDRERLFALQAMDEEDNNRG
jgi:PAS domain S-box-containing protein